MVQGSVLSPLLFDLFINALFRNLDSTGISHKVKGLLGLESAESSRWNQKSYVFATTFHIVAHSSFVVGVGSMASSCGAFHTAAVSEEGWLWIWGDGAHGRLGLGDRRDRCV